MGLIVTPGQLKQKGEFYNQLASMTAAGITIVQGVDMLRRTAPNRALKRTAEQVMEGLVRGQNFTESLRASGRDVPEFDTSLIEAGEASGRIDQCFRLLADFYQERGRLLSTVITQLMYPVFLLHFAVLIFPTSLLADLVWKSEAGPFLINKIRTLIPIYLVLGFILWLFGSNRGPRLRSGIERVMLMIPGIGGLRRDLALARLSAALEALINAGVTIIEAWDLAARASGSQRIMRAVEENKPRLQTGELPSDAIETHSIFPELFVSSYRTGEISGKLDDALRRLYRHYQESATEGLQRFAQWFPRLIYFGVAIVVGYQIISFYAGYFKQLDDVMK
jgi:type IV pilus assembly protein PilC